MTIDQAIQTYGQRAYLTVPTAISRFAFYFEEEMDIYLQQLYGAMSPPCLRYKQIGGSYLYVLPTALLQEASAGGVHVIFDTTTHDMKAIQRILGQFKGTAIAKIYGYTLEMN